MLYSIDVSKSVFAVILMAAALILTFAALLIFRKKLPKDGGRDFAFNGKLSAGKARGAGVIFITTFILASLIFVKITAEYLIFYGLIFASMMSGYLDDRAENPWGEYKKGIIDLLICGVTAFAFVHFNPDLLNINFYFFTLKIHWIAFVIIAAVFLWMMINATNCSDGIDGFCGSLSINSLIFIALIGFSHMVEWEYTKTIIIMIFAIIAYLWFNCEPSTMMMGDAGSRAIGIFLGISILKTGNILFAIPVCFVLLVDGLIGIFKVSCMRFLKLNILQKVRTPLHDHFRKNLGWSNTQTIVRLHIIQVIISYITLKFFG